MKPISPKFQEILTKVAENYSRTGSWKIKDGIIYFEVNGFSKSGSVWLYEDGPENKIYCVARYDEIDEINSFDDLVSIAYYWYDRYSSRDEFSLPSELWVDEFVRLNYLKKVERTIVEYKKS